MKSKKQSVDLTGISAALLLGALGSMAVTLLLTAVTAYLMAGERVGEDSVGFVVVVVLILSSGIGSTLASKRAGHHRLPVCIASGGIYYVTLLASTALLFDGAYQSVGTTLVAVIGGSCAVALLGIKGSSTGHRQRYRKHRNIKVVQNRQMGN